MANSRNMNQRGDPKLGADSLCINKYIIFLIDFNSCCVVCFSALDTMPPPRPPRPPRAMPPSPCRKKKHRHSLCWTCNVCNKCYPTFVGLNLHLAKHYGLYGPATSAELAKSRMSIPTITGAQLQAGLQRAGLSVSQPQGFMLNSNTTARPRLNSNTTTTTTPRQSTPVPSPPMKKGKSHQHENLYIISLILMRNNGENWEMRLLFVLYICLPF